MGSSWPRKLPIREPSSMTKLEVFIPTYNRPVEFERCLRSLENALSHLGFNDSADIGVTINDNSTDYFPQYESVIKKFKPRLEKLGVFYFEYRRTGFNIGGINNIVGGIYSAKSEYVWCLPDDDLARFDSLSILLSVIKSYRPNFISGGWVQKTVIDYNSESNGDDDRQINRVLDVIFERKKVSTFFSKNVVQLQEYVYKTEIIKKFLQINENRSLLNYMWPGLFAVVCLCEDGSFVRLERSVGIFRDGEPKSEWRHLFIRFALVEWPQLCEKLFNRGWISSDEYRLSIGVFRTMFDSLAKRPHILLGLSWRRRLNPYLLLKYHKNHFFGALWSPLLILNSIFKKK